MALCKSLNRTESSYLSSNQSHNFLKASDQRTQNASNDSSLTGAVSSALMTILRSKRTAHHMRRLPSPWDKTLDPQIVPEFWPNRLLRDQASRVQIYHSIIRRQQGFKNQSLHIFPWFITQTLSPLLSHRLAQWSQRKWLPEKDHTIMQRASYQRLKKSITRFNCRLRSAKSVWCSSKKHHQESFRLWRNWGQRLTSMQQ